MMMRIKNQPISVLESFVLALVGFWQNEGKTKKKYIKTPLLDIRYFSIDIKYHSTLAKCFIVCIGVYAFGLVQMTMPM